jgi:hypothetical protein
MVLKTLAGANGPNGYDWLLLLEPLLLAAGTALAGLVYRKVRSLDDIKTKQDEMAHTFDDWAPKVESSVRRAQRTANAAHHRLDLARISMRVWPFDEDDA